MYNNELGALRQAEIWRACPDYEGLYEVSSAGRVRNAAGDILALHPDRTGYPFVGLTKEGKRTSKVLHRLVCRAFHGEPIAPWREAAHLDGDRTNPRADNLKWVGKLQNHSHRRAHGTIPTGEKHPQAKLSNNAVLEIRSTCGLRGALAEKFGVSKATITDVRSGRSWRHI